VVQIKPADADRFVSRPDPAIRVVLIYGSDEGLVAERAERFSRAVLGPAPDPLGLVRIESAAIAEDPPRLADEANAVPLFGGQRVILVRLAGNRPIQSAVEAVLAAPPLDSWVVITAGEQRKGSGLRRICENGKGAAAIACYTDGDRDLDRIIDEETRNAGLTISPDARAALRGLIGSDRLISRSEIGKLCLYAADAGAITIDDVRAVIGDAAAFAMDEAVDAAANGDAAALDRSYRRLLASGTPGAVIAGAAQRHFNFLQKARADFQAGTSPEEIVRRSGIFYQRQTGMARQIGAWSEASIERALARLDQAMLDSRLHRGIEDKIVGQALQFVAHAAGSRRP
jgi:DNA polymerase-3 subunit delta